MCEPQRVEPVEELVGHAFANRVLLRMATNTTMRGFGTLEHLGDAIADVAVAVACWRMGDGPALSAALVSNDALDAEFERTFRGLVRGRSGDVIEALVGAVHLDAGFERAASVAVRLCGGGREWEPLPDVAVDELLCSTPAEYPPWLGTLAIEAVISDVLVRHHGPTGSSQRALSEQRASLASRERLRRVATAQGLSESSSGHDAIAALRSSVAATLLGAGWEAASAVVAEVLFESEVPPSTRT